VTSTAPNTVECPAYARSKVFKHIFRRLPDQVYTILFYKMHIDWTDVAEGIDGVNRIIFVTCEATGMMLCYFQTSQGESGSLNALKKYAYWLLRRYKLKISVIRNNNELIKGNAIKHWLKIMEISHEPSAAHTQNQNGRAERTKNVGFSKGRSMRIHARLPHKLWRKAVNASVYLHNRTPRAQNHWATPYTLFHTYIVERDGIKGHVTPEIAYLKAYGCIAYAASISYIKPHGQTGYISWTPDLI
jgi:hypothetical protein